MDCYWNGRSVLVTGGTGFIGSHLVENLGSKGANIICISNENPSQNSYFLLEGLGGKTKVVYRDLENVNSNDLKNIMCENNVTHVFHLAGQPLLGVAMKKPFETHNLNVMGTARVLEACRLFHRLNEKKLEGIVLCSSINAYDGSNELPYREDSPLVIENRQPYEESVIGMEGVAKMYGGTYNLPICIARLSNVYGPGDLPLRRLVPIISSKILRNEQIELQHEGDVKRNFVYVTDAVDGMVAMAEKANENRCAVFNIGAERPNTIREVVEALVDVSNAKQSKIILIPKSATNGSFDSRDQYSDINKAMSMLGWRPKCSLKEGLTKTFRWYQKNLTR